MEVVTFGRNGRVAGKGWQHSAPAINYVRDRDGVMSMTACCLWFHFVSHFNKQIVID